MNALKHRAYSLATPNAKSPKHKTKDEKKKKKVANCMRGKRSLRVCPKQTKRSSKGGINKSTRERTKTPQRTCDQEKEEGTREHEQAEKNKGLTALR